MTSQAISLILRIRRNNMNFKETLKSLEIANKVEKNNVKIIDNLNKVWETLYNNSRDAMMVFEDHKEELDYLYAKYVK